MNEPNRTSDPAVKKLSDLGDREPMQQRARRLLARARPLTSRGWRFTPKTSNSLRCRSIAPCQGAGSTVSPANQRASWSAMKASARHFEVTGYDYTFDNLIQRGHSASS